MRNQSHQLFYANNMTDRKWDRSRSNSEPQMDLNHMSTEIKLEYEKSKKVLEFLDDSKFPMTQVNGQRKLGPPPGWTGAPPDSNCEVFVGKIPRDLYEAEIYPIFKKKGPIYEIRLMMDFSGSNRGFCFIMYTNHEDAQSAIRDLNGYEIRKGKNIGVVASINNCRLQITRLPENLNPEAFIRKICEMTANVARVAIYRFENEKPKNALIFYKTHMDAAMARRRLVPERNNFFDGNDVSIDWAHPKLSPSSLMKFEDSGVLDENGEVKITRVLLDIKNNHPRNKDDCFNNKIRMYSDDKKPFYRSRSEQLIYHPSKNMKKNIRKIKKPVIFPNDRPDNIDKNGFENTRDINGNIEGHYDIDEKTSLQFFQNDFNHHQLNYEKNKQLANKVINQSLILQAAAQFAYVNPNIAENFFQNNNMEMSLNERKNNELMNFQELEKFNAVSGIQQKFDNMRIDTAKIDENYNISQRRFPNQITYRRNFNSALCDQTNENQRPLLMENLPYQFPVQYNFGDWELCCENQFQTTKNIALQRPAQQNSHCFCSASANNPLLFQSTGGTYLTNDFNNNVNYLNHDTPNNFIRNHESSVRNSPTNRIILPDNSFHIQSMIPQNYDDSQKNLRPILNRSSGMANNHF